MIRVAFCCHGNICRSTLSESVFTYKVKANQYVVRRKIKRLFMHLLKNIQSVYLFSKRL